MSLKAKHISGQSPSKEDYLPATWLKKLPEHAQEAPLVSVVIPCYNHAHFLSEAIESVLEQSYAHSEVIVVDDGSTDATAEMAARYPEIQYVRQENSGLAAARNTGIIHSTGRYLVFLDADDRLLPDALTAGIKCFRQNTECGFVFGSFRRIASDGSILDRANPPKCEDRPYLALLRRNYISMHGTVMYRREALVAVQGFDSSLPACEDYDIYLRIARRFPVQSFNNEVAEYRQHGNNMSGNSDLILTSALQVLTKQWEYVRSDGRLREAYNRGVRFWIETYGQELLWPVAHLRIRGSPHESLQGAATLLQYVPRWFIQQASMQLLQDAYHVVKPTIPPSVRHRLEARWPNLAERFPPQVGSVRFGDLRRTTPIDRWFGYQRGLPVDRYYIEQFLAAHAEDIQGDVLEIKNSDYTRRYGDDRVSRSHVLDVDQTNPHATVIDDLAEGISMPTETYDCFLLTQTLQLIYEVRTALKTSYRILKPGGVLLLTVPGITKIDLGGSWYWSFTDASVRRLLEEVFSPSEVNVEVYGNVLAAQAFLQGLAVEDLDTEELNQQDPEYPVSIVARAVKQER